MWSTLDLSSVTDDLVSRIKTSVDALFKKNGGTFKDFNVAYSGSMPESVRADKDADCHLNFYLLHVSQDKFARNTPVGGGPGQINRKHPLSLELYYLLTAFAGKDSDKEQFVMGAAIRFLHENTVIKIPPDLSRPNGEEYTVTMERQSPDEMSRLWQALSTPLRLSAVYRVSIIFITPSEATPAPAGPPTKIGLSVSPTSLPVLGMAQVFAPSFQATLSAPPPPSQDPEKVAVATVAPVAAIGDLVVISGSGLDSGAFPNVYLTTPGGAEQNIKTWKQAASTPSELQLQIPPTVGALPANAPPPGVYLVSIGTDVPSAVRSNSTALMIAARIDVTASPPELKADISGFYKLQGAGFTPASCQVFLGTVALNAAGGPDPLAGEFLPAPDGASLRFKPPAPLAKGRYWVRVRVNGVESQPSWYVQI